MWYYIFNKEKNSSSFYCCVINHKLSSLKQFMITFLACGLIGFHWAAFLGASQAIQWCGGSGWLIEGSTGLDIQVSFVSQITDFSAEMIWTRAGNWLVVFSPTLLFSFWSAFFVWPIQMAILGFLTPYPSQNELTRK